MLMKTLKDLFDSLMPAALGATPADEAHSLQLAAAVLLVEVMRADTSFHPDERATVLAALREGFALTEDEATRLTELGEATARTSTDLFSFTSRINECFDMPQKLRMVEQMWHVAYADGQLSAHERHVLWRIADLLHVPQGAYQQARIGAEADAATRLPSLLQAPNVGQRTD
jgi:uncharacterized tellurite resistance protein B-like protein